MLRSASRSGYNHDMSNAPTLHLVPRLSGTTGERIQSARQFRRWKQDQMLHEMRRIDAEATPSRKTYSGWENDHKSPTVDEIRLVARATGFPVEDFVADDTIDLDGPRDPAEQVSKSSPWMYDDSRPALKAVA